MYIYIYKYISPSPCWGCFWAPCYFAGGWLFQAVCPCLFSALRCASKFEETHRSGGVLKIQQSTWPPCGQGSTSSLIFFWIFPFFWTVYYCVIFLTMIFWVICFKNPQKSEFHHPFFFFFFCVCVCVLVGKKWQQKPTRCSRVPTEGVGSWYFLGPGTQEIPGVSSNFWT